MRRFHAAAILGLLTLALPASAQADAFVIQSGALEVNDRFEFGFVFLGEGFSAVGEPLSFVLFFGSGVGIDPCLGCGPGRTFDPSFQTNGEIPFQLGSVTLGDSTFRHLAVSPITTSGTLDFDVTPVVFPNTVAQSLTLRTPFTFQGTVRGSQGSAQLFSAAFTGSGTVTQPFLRDSLTGLYRPDLVNLFFEFGAQPATTPEPATVLLLGTGLAGLGTTARRRRQLRALEHVRTAALTSLSRSASDATRCGGGDQPRRQGQYRQCDARSRLRVSN
jgi:PEP-CTERM motif-containing protein